MTSDTKPTSQTGKIRKEVDRLIKNTITLQVDKLNGSIRDAQRQGLKVNLGLAYVSGDPGSTEVRLTQFERPEAANA